MIVFIVLHETGSCSEHSEQHQDAHTPYDPCFASARHAGERNL